MSDNVPSPADQKPDGSAASLGAATFISLLALLVVLLLASALYVPSLRTWLPESKTVDLRPLQEQLAATDRRVEALAETFVTQRETETATSDSTVLNRMADLEARVQSNNEALTVQQVRAQQAAGVPVALALFRLEERFERGQDFTEALALLQRLLAADLSAEDAATLTGAAAGVPSSALLTDQLDQNERALRRAARLAGADTPLERIWAELRSLVLIKTDEVSESDVMGRALADMKAALRRDDTVALQRAWNTLPPSGQQKLADWKKNADQRMSVHGVLQKLIEGVLIVPSGTGAAPQ
ncbi:MAG: hypothetical protein AB7G06_09755 [Bdellovibrionales bacterium]